ncbi:outer mitochondrial membrane transport complex protein-domain-containing protein [Hypoxylon sp. FL1150]|nr:outer mitochondrial membrane transport complex protein-domain-containing protein [Hypoxylon sp. FL1150]
MALELHVWGPAFGLDSIDPECLGAITCFRHCVPREDWTLIASNDAAVSPDCHLPALFHQGTWTSGFASIISYLTACGKLSLEDDDLTPPQQRADALACAAFLATRGAGLIAASLYVSPRAWADVTRPAYSTLLRFPLTWTVPPAVRAAALATAEHQGIGYLAADVDAEESSSSSSLAETTSTGFLRLRERLGPSRAMQPEHTAAIRMQHYAEDFYSVLDEMRGDKKYLLSGDGGGGKPSSVDYLAYGYLQLMRVRTPHPILKTVLEKSYPRLVAFLKEVESYEGHATPQELVWQEPASSGALGLIGRFAEGALEALPGVGDGWGRWRRGGVIAEGGAKDHAQLFVAAAGAVVSVAALGAVALFGGLPSAGASTHRFEPDRQKTGLRQFGEIGSILEGLPSWEQPNGSGSPSR